MRNILKLWSLFLLGALFIVSCSKEDGTFQNLQAGGSILSFTNVVTGFYDLGDVANASIAFDMDSHGDAVSSVKIFKSYNGGASVEHAVINTTPSTVTITLTDAMDGLGITENDLAVGDKFTYTFEITNGSGVSKSGKSQVIPVSCNSSLAGMYDYTTTSTWCGSPTLTGTVEWTEAAAGVYEISDWAYGAYEDCYGGSAAGWGTLQLTDVCNKITQIGEDNYGDTWTFNITSVDGSDLNFTWDNTYGENGTVKLTRTDGTDWPPLVN
jgi:hypothetical protein